MPAWLKKRSVQLTLVLVLLSIAVFVGLWVRRGSVEYVTPRHGPIVEAIYGLGKVKTDRYYEVKLGVPLTVEKLYVREGESVVAGQPLIRFEGGPVFKAPYRGTVTQIAFREAQPVFPQQTAVRLDDLSTKFIEVSLEQQGALRVRPGQPVKVVFEGIRGEVLQGTVAAIFSRNDEFLAQIRVPLSDNILPGMTADVSIEAGRRENALLVPVSAISDGRVHVLRDGKRITLKLKIGGIDGSWAEVEEGDLRDSDRVIVRPEPRKKS